MGKKEKKNNKKETYLTETGALSDSTAKETEKRKGARGGGDASAVTQGVQVVLSPMGSQVIIDQMSACPPPLHDWPPLPSSLY